jgi:hypothetical protein
MGCENTTTFEHAVRYVIEDVANEMGFDKFFLNILPVNNHETGAMGAQVRHRPSGVTTEFEIGPLLLFGSQTEWVREMSRLVRKTILELRCKILNSEFGCSEKLIGWHVSGGCFDTDIGHVTSIDHSSKTINVDSRHFKG